MRKTLPDLQILRHGHIRNWQFQDKANACCPHVHITASAPAATALHVSFDANADGIYYTKHTFTFPLKHADDMDVLWTYLYYVLDYADIHDIPNLNIYTKGVPDNILKTASEFLGLMLEYHVHAIKNMNFVINPNDQPEAFKRLIWEWSDWN